MKCISNPLFYAVILVVGVFCTNVAFAEVITLRPGQEGFDAPLSGHLPNDNRGNMEANVWGSCQGVDNLRYLSSFDLTALAPYSSIQSAMLTLTFSDSFDARHEYIAHLYRVTEEWSEQSVTWLNRDAVEPWSTPGGTVGEEWASTPFTMGGGDGISRNVQTAVTFDVTALVQPWLDGTHQNFGFLLVPETTYVEPPGSATNIYTAPFHSDHSDPNFRPALAVTAVPLPAPQFLSEWSALPDYLAPQKPGAELMILRLGGLMAVTHALA